MSDDANKISETQESAPKPIEPISVIPDNVWWNATSRWLNEHIRNTELSAHVESWNHLGKVLPELRKILADELTKPSA